MSDVTNRRTATSTLYGLVKLPGSYVIVNTGNGHGSTNNRVRIFTTVQASSGSGISYATSSTNAASFTINEAGIYAMSWSDRRGSGAGTETFGFSVNGTGTSTITSLASTNVLQLITHDSTTNGIFNVSGTFVLAATDVIRPHSTGALDATTNARFSITQVARL